MAQAPVFITDGDERAALAATRAIGNAGIPVVVGSARAKSLAGASRYCMREWRYPSPLTDEDAFLSSIKEALRVNDVSQIFPMTDASMQVLAKHREEFGRVGSGLPSLDSYDAISDKYRLMLLAQELNVPIPSTIFVESGDVAQVINRIKEYPVVVKPGRSITRVKDDWIKTNVQYASSVEELLELYRHSPFLKDPSLIQQRITGSGVGVFALCDHGKACALFAHKRIREKPPAGGVSVLRESIALPKPATDYAIRLLQHVKWHGVAMVEFKIEENSDIPMLMEINGRFWGSLQLTTDAGVNFPYLLYQINNGVGVSVPENSYRVGTKSRWLLGDFDHLLLRLFKSRETLRLPPDAPSKMRCVVDFCRFVQRDLHYEVECLTDLGPVLVEYRDWLRNLGAKPQNYIV